VYLATSYVSRSTIPTVSLVDGYNLPMRINNNKGCPVPECAHDLGPNCMYDKTVSRFLFSHSFIVGPAPLKGPYDSTGFPVGCKSACVANLSGNPGSKFRAPTTPL